MLYWKLEGQARLSNIIQAKVINLGIMLGGLPLNSLLNESNGGQVGKQVWDCQQMS